MSRQRAGAFIAVAFLAGAASALLGGYGGVIVTAVLGLVIAAALFHRARRHRAANLPAAAAETPADDNSPLPPRVYAIKPVRQAGLKIVKTVPPVTYTRSAAHLFNAAPQMHAAVDRQNVQPPASRAASVSEIDSAVVLDGDLLLAGRETIIAESLINRYASDRLYVFDRKSPGEAIGPGRLPPLRTVPFSRCVLMAQHWDGNYGHWLVDTLPRVALLDGLYAPHQLRILLRDSAGPIRAVQRESLLALGFEDDQFVWFKGDIIVDHLIYPSPITLPPWTKAPLCIAVLERIAVTMGAEPLLEAEAPRKLYVSRNKDAQDRKLLNEEAVIQRLTQRGYTVLDPGLMDFRAQVRSFANATHVIGNMGAGLTNIAFAPRGVTLLALTTESMTDDFFYDLVSLKQGGYWSLHGSAAGTKPGFRDDFTIDLALLDQVLAEFDA